jgi:ATP-binding cassette, subfamily B, bacterial HlyB/CyaB
LSTDARNGTASFDPASADASSDYSASNSNALAALSLLGRFYEIDIDPEVIAHELGTSARSATTAELIVAAARMGIQLRRLSHLRSDFIRRIRRPALLRNKDGGYVVVVPLPGGNAFRVLDPADHACGRKPRRLSLEAIGSNWSGEIILVANQPGRLSAPSAFGFGWFLQSILRYRRPLTHVLIASVFVQLFALVTPLLFQVVIDKVLAHKALYTLAVVVFSLVSIGVFDVVLQYLRSYALSHTSNRLDVELGARLYRHLIRLPLSYFETRPTGQTIARVRELETIRNFLTGQGLTSLIDVAFAVIFVTVLLLYSVPMTAIVLGAIPFYILVAVVLRPVLRARINEKYNRGAESQQFLVESVIGVHTIKAAAIEPIVERQWTEKLAAYVKTSFEAQMLASIGQNSIQYLNKLTTALLLYVGAHEVIDGRLTVGALIAYNMISGQVFAPILRLSQLWQDFQQVQVSVDRLADIFLSPPEEQPAVYRRLKRMRGAIRFENVHFAYTTQGPAVIKGITLDIEPGQVIGIVGPSGSGKSTIAKLLQRLYVPDRGAISIDGVDLAQMRTDWLRGQMGVVLQENLLFNRSVRDNIALAMPLLDLEAAIAVAKLAGADEFITRLPNGYDSQIVERGANLSGGQRQRIAIARALARDPRILILDEATSALDYESERIIQENMKDIVKGRTVIIIAHRLAAVRHCDRIVGLSDGQIVEDGPHEELLGRRNGLYAHLWQLQSAGASR